MLRQALWILVLLTHIENGSRVLGKNKLAYIFLHPQFSHFLRDTVQLTRLKVWNNVKVLWNLYESGMQVSGIWTWLESDTSQIDRSTSGSITSTRKPIFSPEILFTSYRYRYHICVHIIHSRKRRPPSNNERNVVSPVFFFFYRRAHKALYTQLRWVQLPVPAKCSIFSHSARTCSFVFSRRWNTQVIPQCSASKRKSTCFLISSSSYSKKILKPIFFKSHSLDDNLSMNMPKKTPKSGWSKRLPLLPASICLK